MAASTQGWFRRAILAFAALLGLQATWILVAELTRPALPAFAPDAEAAAAAATRRSAATVAARLCCVRGDLWADCALTYTDLFWRENRNPARADTSKMFEEAHDIAERALILAPHDARIWLILAVLNARLDWLTHGAAASLKMSYYTGTNEIALIPLRLLIAIHSDVFIDSELQQMLRRDVRPIVTRHPQLKPAIATAYRDAPPAGKRFLREA